MNTQTPTTGACNVERVNRFRFIKYNGPPIKSDGKEYPVSLWYDGSKDRYVWRITSPTTGKTVRTFTSLDELGNFRKLIG